MSQTNISKEERLYFKYKSKYINLKNKMIGGAPPNSYNSRDTKEQEPTKNSFIKFFGQNSPSNKKEVIPKEITIEAEKLAKEDMEERKEFFTNKIQLKFYSEKLKKYKEDLNKLMADSNIGYFNDIDSKLKDLNDKLEDLKKSVNKIEEFKKLGLTSNINITLKKCKTAYDFVKEKTGKEPITKCIG